MEFIKGLSDEYLKWFVRPLVVGLTFWAANLAFKTFVENISIKTEFQALKKDVKQAIEAAKGNSDVHQRMGERINENARQIFILKNTK